MCLQHMVTYLGMTPLGFTPKLSIFLKDRRAQTAHIVFNRRFFRFFWTAPSLPFWKLLEGTATPAKDQLRMS